MALCIAVLGSTGSIGRQTLQVVDAFPDRLQVVGLAAGGNSELLNQQIRRHRPQLVSVGRRGAAALDIEPGRQLAGAEGLVAVASHPDVDLVVVATSGKVGLAPTMAALRAGKEVALANKEVLVMAGEIVMAEARRQGKQIRPLDSEHSALWQCLQGETSDAVANLILTASGGPFRTWEASRLATATAADALRHPNWTMGPKITVDSATLMNKGFEVIEARWLFDVPYERIQVLVHPQSIIHSLVEFKDGSLKAQLGAPDMRLPIQYALLYPERAAGTVDRLDWRALQDLTFGQPDEKRFPCLALARTAGRQGGTYPTVLSAVDEVAVAAFLDGQITFLRIAEALDEVLAAHRPVYNPEWEDVLAADAWARQAAQAALARRSGHSVVIDAAETP